MLFITIALQISSEEAFQLATHNVSGVRMEIVSDAPPPPPEDEE
jgi:hypothetical protein